MTMSRRSIPVAALLRVSSEAQAADDRGGLPRQEQAVANASRVHGLRVIYTARLEGVSGNRVAATREWVEIRRLLETKAIRGVVADSVDRLCRASELDLGVLADLQKHNATLFTPGEARAMGGSGDALIAGIMALIGGRERAEIARRSKAAKEALRRQGRWTESNARLPFGVQYDKATHTWIYTDEVQQVVAAARRYASGSASVRQIALELGWNINSLRNRLLHPLYRGWMVCDSRWEILADGSRRRVPRAPEDVIKVKVFEEPAFDEELQDAIDRRMRDQARRYAKADDGNQVDKHYLRGVLFCARCGARLDTLTQNRVRVDGTRHRRYRCAGAQRRRIPQNALPPCQAGGVGADELHFAAVEVVSLVMPWDADELGRLVQGDAVAEQEAAELEAQRARARVDRLTKRRGRLVDLHLDGALTREEFDSRRLDIDADLESARQRLADADAVARAGDPVPAMRAFLGWLGGESGLSLPVDAPALGDALRAIGGRLYVDVPRGRSPKRVEFTRLVFRPGALIAAMGAARACAGEEPDTGESMHRKMSSRRAPLDR